jgi:hypothetical protein
MFAPLFSMLSTLQSCFRTRAALHAEILALRHQLLVLQRSSREHRLRLHVWDRAFWVWLSRLWPGWCSALLIVKPETVIAWHRKGFRGVTTSGRTSPPIRTTGSLSGSLFSLLTCSSANRPNVSSRVITMGPSDSSCDLGEDSDFKSLLPF